MASQYHHQDPRVVFTVNGVHAYHIQDGRESSLTPSGAQTMSLLMISTASVAGQPDDDVYLHLTLPPELEIPLPAHTQVYPRPPHSYLIPRSDLGPDSGAFTRIELPEKVRQDDVETFETILAQCTAFMERAPPPTGDAHNKPYSTSDWQAGHKLGGGKTQTGHVVLVDEDDGSVCGELSEGAQIYEDPSLSHGSKHPVTVEISEDGKRVDIRPATEEYLRLAKMPMYSNSTLVQSAASASRFVVTSSSRLGSMMTSQAEQFTQRSAPTSKPMTFSPAAKERARKIHGMTQSGAQISAKTVGSLANYTQNMAARMTGKGDRKEKGESYKPGLFNKSLIAFTTVMDGLAESGTRLVTDAGTASTIAVNHKYGADAGEIAATVAGGVRNVGLVYVDVTGVSRKAIIKSVAKGMVIGKVKDKNGKEQDVVVGEGDGGALPQEVLQQHQAATPGGGSGYNSQSTSGYSTPAGYGTKPTPAYPSAAPGPGGYSDTKRYM